MNIEERIKSYLGNGGLFNPELMEHEKVRDLIMACRDELGRLEHELTESRNAERLVRMQLAAARSDIGTPPEGSHPDESKPRAETWHKERANWRQEVGQLRFELFNRDMEIKQWRDTVRQIEECCDKPSNVWDIADAALAAHQP